MCAGCDAFASRHFSVVRKYKHLKKFTFEIEDQDIYDLTVVWLSSFETKIYIYTVGMKCGF